MLVLYVPLGVVVFIVSGSTFLKWVVVACLVWSVLHLMYLSAAIKRSRAG